ncbi:MAG: alpha/beta fold hydrolase [Planctomycetota bacterium]|jgi:alpha-beta hydrolase superfamily lysophospholipase
MSVKVKRRNWLKVAVKFFIRACLAVLIIFVIILLVRAFDTRRGPDLEKWHKVKLLNEFNRRPYSGEITFEQYREMEDKLFAELDEKVIEKAGQSEQDKYNRYNRLSLSSPDRFSQNWNRSFELVPEQIEGGILLIHGLTDSPYSMKTLAELFHESNFYVLSLRMPGHGTIPAALTNVTWRDWMAAVRVGVRHVRQKSGPEKPFYMAGYSNGGALSLLYTLESLENEDLAHPDRLFLFSPAIGITKFAMMARWLKLTSIVPYFEKSKWNVIAPEYDPFKYNSFPLNAAEQSYNLANKIQKSILDCHSKGSLSKLPAVITFQSAVDSTVIAQDIVNDFYNRLSPNGHELVIFDTNRHALLHNFLKTPPLKAFSEPELSKKYPYRLSVVTNKDPNSDEVVVKTKEENTDSFEEIELNMNWPHGIYSLSHLAIPFPVEHPLYGTNPSTTPNDHIQLGNIYLRGERNVLRISEKDLTRLRCNPFLDYVKDRINAIIQEDKN